MASANTWRISTPAFPHYYCISFLINWSGVQTSMRFSTYDHYTQQYPQNHKVSYEQISTQLAHYPIIMMYILLKLSDCLLITFFIYSAMFIDLLPIVLSKLHISDMLLITGTTICLLISGVIDYTIHKGIKSLLLLLPFASTTLGLHSLDPWTLRMQTISLALPLHYQNTDYPMFHSTVHYRCLIFRYQENLLTDFCYYFGSEINVTL